MVFQDDERTARFVIPSLGRKKTFRVDEMTLALIPLLDGAHTVDGLHAVLEGASGFTADHLAEVLATMADEGLVVDAAPSGSPGSDVGGESRYERQLQLFGEIGHALFASRAPDPPELQRRLESATVAIVGLGGTGTWVAQSLAGAGIGCLRLCDFDRVEESNLNRQLLYTVSDLGRPKVEAARERLLDLNPYVRVETFEHRVEDREGLRPLVDGASFVVNCSDHPSTEVTSDWVSEECLPRLVPHIVGGGYASQLGSLGLTVIPGRTSCWTCVRRRVLVGLTGPDTSSLLKRGGGAIGSLGMFSAVVGNLLAWEVVRVVMGASPRLVNRVGEIDFIDLAIRWRAIERDPDCSACGDLLEVALP